MEASPSAKLSGSPMFTDETVQNNYENMPTEILIMLFDLVPPKDMVKFRRVCTRWRDIVDALLADGTVWEKFCKREFGQVYQQAMWKTPNITSWAGLYRSLALWSQLPKAKETIVEFCHSDTIDEEQRCVVGQKKGLIMIHKRCRVLYHELPSLKESKRKGMVGTYITFVELQDLVVMLALNGKLHVARKKKQDWHSDLVVDENNDDVISENVKTFIVAGRYVIYTKFRNELYLLDFDDVNKVSHHIEVPDDLNPDIPVGISAIGVKDGHIYILTMSQNLFKYDRTDRTVTLKLQLNARTNLMDCMYQHNMLEDLDWRHYYILMSHLSNRRHTGLLKLISKMQIYGDLFFVGTESGILNMYYKPFFSGRLDLTLFAPMKSFNLSSRIEVPILSIYPIINIEVIETKEGHTILVCMHRKILAITYEYNFETKSVEVTADKQ